MTVEELFSVRTDNNKLNSLYLELAQLEEFNPYKKNIITDMPRGGNGKDFNEWYVSEKERIEREISFYKKKIQRDRKKVDGYIEQAPYPECDIIRYRVINYLSWNDIGDIIGYDRKSVSNKFYNYINNSHDYPILP